MAKVGDRVKVTVRGPASLSGTASLESGEMVLSGAIVGEEGAHWIVRLDTSFNGRNLVRVAKDKVAEPAA